MRVGRAFVLVIHVQAKRYHDGVGGVLLPLLLLLLLLLVPSMLM